jgi:hypothetical protein
MYSGNIANCILQFVSNRRRLLIFCKLDCSFCRNLSFLDRIIWWCPQKAVILHRFSMTPALKVSHNDRMPTHWRERKTGISSVKERIVMNNEMNRAVQAKKRILMIVATVVALVTGVIFAEAAKGNDNFTVRFRENTLVVTSTQMEEARLYSMQGKLLQKEKGNFAEFELERGTYRLYAKVNGETLSRRIELR